MSINPLANWVPCSHSVTIDSATFYVVSWCCCACCVATRLFASDDYIVCRPSPIHNVRSASFIVPLMLRLHTFIMQIAVSAVFALNCWCVCDCKGESVMRNHVIWPAHCPVRCRIWYCKMSSKFPDSLGHSLLSSQCTSHELCFVCVVIGMVGLSMTVESDEVYFRNSWRDIKLAEWFSHCLPDECYMS